MKIAVVGAGGVGGYYGGVLARAGHEVGLLARGEHLAALRRGGLEVRTPEGTFQAPVQAVAEAADLGDPDLALIAVKSYSLAEVATAARLLAERGAAVLPLLNGVEAAERLIAWGVAAESVLGGMTEISALRVAPGVVERRSPFQRVTLGERAGGLSERAERFAAVFRAAGVTARVSADIAADLWRKLAFIASMAAACGLARSPIGPVREAPLGNLLLERAVGEALAVARARGVGVGDGDEATVVGFFAGLPGAMVPSFLVDLEAGRPTELDDLSGALSRLGREVGVATPVHDTAVAALGAAAAKASG